MGTRTRRQGMINKTTTTKIMTELYSNLVTMLTILIKLRNSLIMT